MFKKVFCLLSALVVLSAAWVVNSKSDFSSYASSFEVYSLTSSSSALIEIKTKNDLLLSFNRYGTSCVVDNLVTVEQIINDFNAKILFIETTENGISYYAFSENLKYRASIKGEVINLHIFDNGEFLKIGSPIIFGSF